jgi:uncharacterized membrane protein YtjA (UPF0391 family)
MSRRMRARIRGQPAWLGKRTEKEWQMLYWAAVFFVIALLAAIFGFGGIAAGAAEIGKILFFIFLVVFAVTLILGLINRR